MLQSAQQYNQFFLQELERLNPAQREAVAHIEGPVLVVAGPGTGKTHILAARVGKILLDTDAQPNNILCLTFTDAGVHAMRKRLLELIGPVAHLVHIFTFHSFCNAIIQNNLELFGRQELSPITDLERIEIIRQIIDELDLEHPLKRYQSDAYFYEEHLYDLFKRIKSEDWTVAFVHQKIEAYLQDLPNRPDFVYQMTRGTFQKGALKKAKLEEAHEKMEKLRAAVALFPRFQQLMRQRQRYDYDDMILWVLRAFEEQEALLLNYQEQYLYFLIDEYQDTNGSQNNILRKLVAYWDNPNVFIVGDDDQSIYEFQGARLKNLTDFYETYKADLKIILLLDNYRSSSLILNTSRQLIDYNKIRIVNSLQEWGIEKALVARHPAFAASKMTPRIAVYPNRAQEEAAVVQQIETLQAANFPLEEVAIIYAKHKQARNVITLLEKKGIPYRTRRKVNVLTLPLVDSLRELLLYFQAELTNPYSGEALLFRILHYPFLNIPPAAIANLSFFLSKLDWQERPMWRQALSDEELLHEVAPAGASALRRLSDFIENSLRHYHSTGLSSFVESVMNRSGLLEYALQQSDKIGALEATKTFFDFVVQETLRNPRLRLSQLLSILQSMDDNRLPLELDKVISSEKGVNLLTAHSAKGLEFQHVFLIDCIKESWEPSNKSSAYRFSLPDTLTLSGTEDALEAQRRLFYVAMTRAKEGLYLSYSEQDEKGKALQQAIFIDEVSRQEGIEIVQPILSEEVMAASQLLPLLEVSKPRLPAQDKNDIDRLLEGFTLSISGLNQYLKCPLSFYYEQILKVPIATSQFASYGLAMHNALRRFFEKMLLSKQKKFPAAAALLQLFEYEIQKLKSNFSPVEYDRRLALGKRNLAAYYQQHQNSWHKRVRVELNIRNAQIDGVPITGTIDRIEWEESLSATIWDYKTGNPDLAKVRDAQHQTPYGGSYWRQLVFYKLLYENFDKSARQVQSGVISWLDPDAKGQFINSVINFSKQDTNFLRAILRETYQKIKNHEFYEGCGKSDCQWCNFVKHRESADSFAASEVEELDD